LSAKNLLDQVGGFMGINFSQVLLSSIAFGVGYYIKARFEINQEQLINKLQMQITEMKKDGEKKVQTLEYQIWQVEQERDRLERNFFEFKEKAKAGAFESIAKEKVEKSSKKNVLKSFV
jgi:hypothetical protein